MNDKVPFLPIRLDLIAAASPVGMLLIDDAEYVVYANSAAQKLFKNRLLSSKKYRCGDFISCENKNRSSDGCGYSGKCPDCPILNAIRSTFNANPEQEKTGEAEVVQCPDFNKIWVKYTTKKLNIEKQNWVLLSIDDISKLKRVEEKLRQREERYRSLANSGHAMVWTAGLDMGCDFFNEPWLRFTGRELADELGRGWLENLHPEDRRQCMHTYTDSFKKKEKFSMCYRVTRYDGEYRWIEDFGSPMYDTDGQFTGYIGHCFDITERLEIERRLENALDFSRRVFDSTDANTAIIDKKWIIADHNQAWSDFALNNNAAGEALWSIGASYLQEVPHDSKDFELAQQAFAGIQNVLDGNLNFFEMDYPCPSSLEEDRWFSMRVFPMKGGLDQVMICHTDITERKLAEIALKKSEQQYKVLVDTLPYGVEEINLDGQMIFLNDAYHRILGYKPGELVGTHIWDHDPTPGAKKKLKDYFEYIKSDMPTPEPYISKNRRKDGSIIDVHVNWNYSFDERGQLKGFTAVMTDISDRIKSEQALRESEERYRTIFMNSPLGIFRSTFDGVFLEVNPALTDMLGYASAEEVLKNITNIAEQIYVKSEDRSEIVAKQINSSDISTHLNWYRRKDGSEFLANLYLKTISDEENNPLYLEGIVEDITDRKQAEDRLEIESKKFKLLLELFPGYICLQASDYSIRYANQYFINEFGNPEGRFCYELLQAREKPCDECPTFTVFETRKPVVWEWEKPLNGKTYLIYDFPFIDDDGSELVLEFGMDITNRKKQENQLKQKQTELGAYSKKLEDMNTALNVLIDHRDEEKQKRENEIISGFKKLVLPYLDKSINEKSREEILLTFNILSRNLKEVLFKGSATAEVIFENFTPLEVKVSDLISQDKTTKEIANILHISPRAVYFHRENIRKKLDLSKKKISLKTYLQTRR